MQLWLGLPGLACPNSLRAPAGAPWCRLGLADHPKPREVREGLASALPSLSACVASLRAAAQGSRACLRLVLLLRSRW
jgi:hypothetical protein